MKNPAVYESDLRHLKSFNFRVRCRGFMSTHSTMLYSMYSNKMNLECENLFNQLKLFISKLSDSLRIKMDTEVARLVWKRSTHWSPLTSNDLSDDGIDIDTIISTILECRYKRLEKLLSHYTKSFFHFLVQINKELMHLYEALDNYHPNLSLNSFAQLSTILPLTTMILNSN